MKEEWPILMTSRIKLRGTPTLAVYLVPHLSGCRSSLRASMIAPLGSKKVLFFNVLMSDICVELPRHTSKILSTAKKPQTTATAMIGEFDRKGFNGAGDTYLRKVDKKDLSK